MDASHGPLAPFEVLGQRTWQPGSPAGWPDRSADWDGASALLKRLEWADAVGGRLGIKASGGIRTAADAVAMLDAGATRLGLSGTRAVLDGLAPDR